MPVPWNGMDIGVLSTPGTAQAADGTFTLTGSGGDMGGPSDQFHFVYQSLTGDCTLIARVNSRADPMKAGLMARDALATTSDFVAVLAEPRQGVFSAYRNQYSPQAASESATAVSSVWLKLIKRGTTVQNYWAPDQNGAPGTWKPVGGSRPIASGMIYIGLCLSRGAAAFDHVSLATGSQFLLDDGVYTLSPASAPGMVLEVSGDTVSLAALTGAPSQKWRLVSKGGFASLQPFSDLSRALTVPGANSQSGSKVAVTTDSGQDSQRWSLSLNTNGTYCLRPKFDTGIGLDDFSGNATPAAVLDIWNYDRDDPHLQWMINPAP